MLEAVEKRFGAIRAPNPVEWLSDNGSPYTARDTRLFAAQLNLTPCFTPVASPESNGVSEAFVKTIKRDYVGVRALPTNPPHCPVKGGQLQVPIVSHANFARHKQLICLTLARCAKITNCARFSFGRHAPGRQACNAIK